MENYKAFSGVIQFRRDITENWELNKDVVPVAGEPCFDLSLGTLKIGDGVKTYAQLDVIGKGDSIAVSADGNSIILSDGVFKLAGFDAAETGAQPRKKEDGTLEWIVPSTEIIDNLQTAVADLQTDVSEIQEILNPSDEGAEPLLYRIGALETKMDGTGEGSVDAKINAKINEFATNVTDDGVVNSYKELIDYVASHNNEAVDMANDIINLQELVGSTSVADQIAAAIDGIESGTHTNIIESISINGTPLEIYDKNVDIPVSTNDTPGVVKGSSEITVGTDGALEIGQVSVSKLVQEPGVTLVLDGGAAN